MKRSARTVVYERHFDHRQADLPRSDRRRNMMAGLVLGTAFVVLYSVGIHFIFGQMEQSPAAEMPSQMAANVMMAEARNGFLMMGLYAATLLSVAMAALLGADTLAGEINSGTIQTVATKPIRRADVVLGKWLGFAELLGLYVLLLCGGVVLSTFVQSGTYTSKSAGCAWAVVTGMRSLSRLRENVPI